MSKRQHGNKESKKPKQAVPSPKPAVPAITTTADPAVAPRQKR